MDIRAVAANAAQTTARTSLSGNFDTFLRLLTTQLQNQDPLEPMDATKFTEQLVSYSQVEQQINTNANLESLIALNKSAIGANAITYLGKTVLTGGAATALEGGAAKWRYALTSDANTLQLTIKDASGKTVRTMTGNKNVGMHEFTWDGKKTNGETAEDVHDTDEAGDRHSIERAGRRRPAGFRRLLFGHGHGCSCRKSILTRPAGRAPREEYHGGER